MVVWVRLELTTSRLSIECSNQLSYQTILARGERFELPDPLLGLQFSRLAPSTTRPSPHIGAHSEIRTLDPPIKSRLL